MAYLIVLIKLFGFIISIACLCLFFLRYFNYTSTFQANPPNQRRVIPVQHEQAPVNNFQQHWPQHDPNQMPQPVYTAANHNHGFDYGGKMPQPSGQQYQQNPATLFQHHNPSNISNQHAHRAFNQQFHVG